MAIIQDAFKVDNDGSIDLDQFVMTFNNIEQMLDDCSSDQASPAKIDQPEE